MPEIEAARNRSLDCNTPKQKRDWVYPKQILTGNLEEVKYLRKEVETLLSTTQHGKAGDALKTWLTEVKERTIEKEKENKINHLAKKHSTIAKLRGIYHLIGDGMGKEGSLKELANVRRMGKWDMLEANKKEIEEDLAEITRKEQQLWLDNRGYEEYTYGERCSRKFFDGMRTSMAFSHINKAFSQTSNVCATSTNVILDIREFYCGTNGILNLSHKHTERSERCETFLERYRNDPELNREGEIIERGRENMNTKTRRSCRNVILKAIQADGKVLDKEQSISLNT